MSDAGGGKKPPVEPQAGPGPGPGRAAGERGLPGSFPLVLKKLMENPPRGARLDKEKGKEKLEEDEAAAASTMAVSASLMPPIWDKTIPYDGESFHLEYMDLDEFLLENGIPASPTHLAQNLLLPVAELEGKESASSSTASPPSSSTAVFPPSETVSSTESSLEKERETPSPIDPNCVEVDVNFNPDPADLVLSSVPGGELFNPRKHKFAEEDLKPQPMIKKAKKVFVPDEQKDEKYWTRRKKNNVAAKRSRDARRLKENQITIRAAFLEKENTALRTEVAELRKEVGKCKTIVSNAQARLGFKGRVPRLRSLTSRSRDPPSTRRSENRPPQPLTRRWRAGACFSRSARSFLLCSPVQAWPGPLSPKSRRGLSRSCFRIQPRACGLKGVTQQDTWSPGRSTTLME